MANQIESGNILAEEQGTFFKINESGRYVLITAKKFMIGD